MTSEFVGGVPVEGPLHPERQRQAAMLLEDPPEISQTFSTRDKTEREKKILTAFTTVTGYREAQVIGINEKTLVVVTANGGKYQLNKAGTLIRHLSGPAPIKPRNGRKGAKVQPTRATAGSETNEGESTNPPRQPVDDDGDDEE
jgi:hypothetical protein